jgi:hypothetical protein
MLERHDDGDEFVRDNITDKQHVVANHEEFMEPEITLHALTGWAAPKTMRVTAKIGSNDIFTLIDSRSTHNFISKRMANLLRLPVVSTNAFTVRVANGENLKCQENFNEVQVDLQGSIFFLNIVFSTTHRARFSAGNSMAQVTQFCGLQLETVNHGILLGK